MPEKANESSQVQKYRKKLEKTIDNEKKLINQASIQKTKSSIHKWISDHSKERISLKNKGIALFDEKQHPAATKSKFILKLAADLKANKKDTLNKLITFKASKV